MARSNADLLAMKAELTNDPAGLGLTTLPADDAANATIINTVSAAFQINRKDVPAGEVAKSIDRVEYNAATLADRQWIDLQLGTGLIDARIGTEQRDGFLGIFGPLTETRANLLALLSRDGKRWEQLVQDGTLEQEGDWSPSEISQARQAT